MNRQGADRQLFTAILTLYPILLPFSVRVPFPVIFLPYAALVMFPAAWQGWHTILTVLPTFFCRPTLSNRPTRALNAPCIQAGPNKATMPSSA